jgi:hypothetical protein
MLIMKIAYRQGFGLRLAMTIANLLLTGLLYSPAIAEESTLSEPPLASVNGKAITNTDVDAYSDLYQTPRDFALRDLIEVTLLKAAANDLKITLPAEPWSTEIREGLEIAIARGFGFKEAKPRIDLVVDHAWIKDADSAQQRAAARSSMEKLRAVVVAGATIPKAFEQLHLDATLWHIGDHEVYPFDSIPVEGRNLPPGSVTPIIPGDGGLNLFTIY